MKWLKGKKSIIGSVLCGIIVALFALKVIDETTALLLLSTVGTATGISYRLGMNNGMGGG